MDSPRTSQVHSAPFGRPALYRPSPISSQSSPSVPSSTYQSSSSLSSLSLPSDMGPSAPSQTSATPFQPSAAPLPSPTTQTSGASQYFGSLHPSSQTGQAPPQSRPQQQRQQSCGCEYRPDRTAAGATAAETAKLLNYNALVAEAAKRAQMAVLMRDLGEMEM